MDSTWSVRIPDEMKEKISGMISESGLNSKDFLAQIIQIYELKQVKDLQPLMESDIDELSAITGRINNIFINIGNRITSYLRQKDDENHLKLTEKSEMLELFHKKIKEQGENLLEYQNRVNVLEKENEEVSIRFAQLNEICEANKALLAEYKDKSDTLLELLNENKEYKGIIENLKSELSAKKELQQLLKIKSQEYEASISNLKNQLQASEQEFKIALQKEQELFQLNKDKEILQLKTEYQQKMELAHQSYSDKTKELLLLIEEMQKPAKKAPDKDKMKKEKVD
jgi:hypothetical protein